MKPTTFKMRNKQRLMALMIAGTVVGLGYQADIAQADTTAVEPGDSTDQSTATSTTTAKTVTLSQQSPTTAENGAAAETDSRAAEKTPATNLTNPPATDGATATNTDQTPTTTASPAATTTTPTAKAAAKPAAVTPQARAISTPTTTAPQSTNSPAVTPTTTAASIVKTGTFGTAPWTLDSDGNMVISAGTFRGGELGSYNHTDVKHVTFAGKVVLGTDASRLFSGWSSLTGIDGLANLDTSQTVLMDDMFSQTGLQQLDLSAANWDTSHVLDMSYMFANNPALTTVNVTGLDTSQVTNMAQMFFNDPLLATITGTGDWDTGQVTDMNAMFSNNTWQTAYNDALQTVDVANWDTSHVTDMRSMFEGDRALTQLDLSHWQTGHVKYLAQMFAEDAAIDHLDVSHWDVGQVLTTTSMFENTTALTAIDLSQWHPTAIRAVNNMFAGDRSLTKLDLSNIDMNAVSSLNHLLQGTVSLQELKLGTNSHLFDGEDQVNLLDAPISATFTGKWQAEGSGKTYTAADLNTGYDGATMADTYVWEKVATTAPDTGNHGGTTTLPDNTNNGTATDSTAETGGDGDMITIPDTGTPVKKPATGGSAAQINSHPTKKTPKAKSKKSAMHPQTLAKPVTGTSISQQVATDKTVRLTARTNKDKSAKPAATVLPQTAEASTSWLSVLGVLGLSLVGLHWFKKQD